MKRKTMKTIWNIVLYLMVFIFLSGLIIAYTFEGMELVGVGLMLIVLFIWLIGYLMMEERGIV